jgi:hypothetical protein
MDCLGGDKGEYRRQQGQEQVTRQRSIVDGTRYRHILTDRG